MSISRLRAALVSATAAALLTITGSPALAASDPLAVSAELLSADGPGCAAPAVILEDGYLDIRPQTGGDSSLHLTGAESTECVLAVRIRLDQPARLRPAQYILDGAISTSGATTPGYHFQSSFDSIDWYGLRSTLPAGYTGGLYQGGGSRFDPTGPCTTEIDLSFRIGLSLTTPTPTDAIWLEAHHGAVAELKTLTCS